MGIYVVANFPLLKLSQKCVAKIARSDGSAGHLEELPLFFKKLTEYCCYFVYTLNIPKCQLIVKEASRIKALRLFEGVPVDTVDGCRVLGSVKGNEKA